MMVAAMSRHLKDGEVAIMGAYSALPMLASRLAQLTHAPNLSFICGGSGAINPMLEPLPESSCDDRLLKAECIYPLPDVIDLEAKPEIDVFFAGGLQIDAQGNCNLIGIGRPGEIIFRGPGSVGLPFLSRAGRYVIYAMAHTTRNFAPRVDFISGPGFIERKLIGKGPSLVVTPLCVMDFENRRMRLKSTHPGITAEMVKENTGFDIIIPEEVKETRPPTDEELELMRRLDPTGAARESIK
ncbi:MAG: CoA-transferase subunit beta [Thermoplasmata archaeon]